MKMLAQGGYPQPGQMPAGYPPYPYPMMPGYATAPPPTGKAGKAVAGAETTTKGRKRRKRIPQGGPKKPATSFVLFSNTVREQVKEEHPGLSFLDLGRKLGEMWREMDPNVRSSILHAYIPNQHLLTPAVLAELLSYLEKRGHIYSSERSELVKVARRSKRATTTTISRSTDILHLLIARSVAHAAACYVPSALILPSARILRPLCFLIGRSSFLDS
jgi:hypothetical protein